MWKLYKQQRESGSPVDKLDLIMESDSLDGLKSEARRLAIKDGCLPKDQFWLYSEELKNYELSVDHKYKFIIREW
jgi:hypothetical protein